MLEEVLIQLSTFDVVLFHERNPRLLESFFYAQLFFGIVTSGKHLLIIDFHKQSQVSIVLCATLRRIVPEVLLLHLGESVLMLLLSLLILLLMLALIVKELVQQIPLRLKLFLRTLFIELYHHMKVLHLQLLDGFLIHSIGHFPIDVALLLCCHLLIIRSLFLLNGSLRNLVRLFLDGLVVGSLNGKPFVLSQISMLQLLLIIFHLNLLHPLGVVKEVLFPLGIGDTIDGFLTLLPFRFNMKLVLLAVILTIPTIQTTTRATISTVAIALINRHGISLV